MENGGARGRIGLRGSTRGEIHSKQLAKGFRLLDGVTGKNFKRRGGPIWLRKSNLE